MIAGIILCILAFISLILGIVLQIYYPDSIFGMLCVLALLAIPGIICIVNDVNPIPTESDVFNGTAEYVETIHITNGDTVKTYKIEWKYDY